jgi:MYXO-CTERM domain-containing protein
MLVLRLLLPTLLATAALLAPARGDAFCGFYVSGADTRLTNNATSVVMMRDGTRTVLSMQNNYQGPPQDFAMVVPVPVILQEKDVKTLSREVFDRIDQLAAPRLVEYWEQDPCPPPEPDYDYRKKSGMSKEDAMPVQEMSGPADHGVRIEAKFTVGEYQILILSAEYSSGLDAWLRQNNYKIPAGAAEVLRPYVAAGMKFFVAKVDVKKVQFNPKGQAMLSPLRFHYDSDTFALPVRLGLLNASGKQDLLVHILAKADRYELANYRNAAIPTNIEVDDSTRRNFSAFYAAMFDRVLERHPGAIVTEYAWQANNCDPCPVPPLDPSELTVLGADVSPTPSSSPNPGDYVLTRLHARYGAESLGEDLVFRAGLPIVGGRETGGPESNERGATVTSQNNFQARFIIRHPWKGAIKCKNPRRGVWGGPPGGVEPPAIAARDLAFVARDQPLRSFLKKELLDETMLPGDPVKVDPYPRSLDSKEPVPGQDPTTHNNTPLEPGPPQIAVPMPPSSSGCASCDATAGSGLAGLGLLALAGLALRRRRR